MKKKLGYKNEKINLYEIIAFVIFNILAFVLLFSLILNKKEYDPSFRIFFFIFLFFYIVILYSIYVFHIFIPCFKTQKTNKLIKAKGVKVSGWIEKFDYEVFYRHVHQSSRKVESFRLHITYTHPKTHQKEEYVTPSLAFSPLKDLGARNCNVYILESEIYVTDFVKNETHQSIWNENDSSMIQMQDAIRKFKKEQTALFKFEFFLFIVYMCIIFFLMFLNQ